MIRVSDVHVEYAWESYKVEAIKGVTLDVNQGDYVAIVGPAGSGKSTLMSALAGLIFPRKGDIFFGKHCINKSSRARRARIRAENFGIIFQFSDMIGRFTVEENLRFSWQARNKSEDGFEARLVYLIERLDMADLLKFRPSKLSGGQMQKAAIANALIKNAPFILADEPSGDLDPESLKLLKKLFVEESKSGKTIVLITHDTKLASDAKSIFELVDGKVAGVLK